MYTTNNHGVTITVATLSFHICTTIVKY